MNQEILGFIEFEHNSNPFCYNDGILKIFPNNNENWKEEKKKLLTELANKFNSNVEVRPFTLKGTTAEEKGIIFYTDGLESNNNGIKQYNVIAYHIYIKNMYINNNGIDGLHFMAKELNYFLKPYLCYRYYIPTEANKEDNMKIGFSDIIEKDCGKINYLNNNIKILLSITQQSNFNNADPFHSFTKMTFKFSKAENDLIKILKYINLESDFIKYICYRKNINYSNIETFIYTEDGLPFSIGNIYIVSEQPDESTKHLKCIMEYDYISSCIKKLFDDLKRNKMLLSYYPTTHDDIHYYTSARAIGIFSSFERECELLDIKVRGEEFVSTRNNIIQILKDEKNTGKYSSKQKKHISQILNTISKIDSSMADYYNKVLNDNYNVMEYFIRKNYKIKKISSNTIKSISKRLNDMRNGLVHSKLDFKFKTINILDLNILEILIQSNRLKHYKLEDKNIIEALKTIY